jgi:hypothetical protein
VSVGVIITRFLSPTVSRGDGGLPRHPLGGGRKERGSMAAASVSITCLAMPQSCLPLSANQAPDSVEREALWQALHGGQAIRRESTMVSWRDAYSPFRGL